MLAHVVESLLYAALTLAVWLWRFGLARENAAPLFATTFLAFFFIKPLVRFTIGYVWRPRA